MDRKNIAIVGGGPSAMMAADVLSKFHNVTIYDKEKSIAQKFLVAGKGGFNLTNSLQGTELTEKYTPKHFMCNSLLAFDSISLRGWFAKIGIETFVGTSGRVFPAKGIRPAEVLDKIKKKLLSNNVKIIVEAEFIGFDGEQNPQIKYKNKTKSVVADHYIFALGGASWSITGSNGKWRKYFREIGVNIIPFEASNCGININWDENIIKNHQGKPLKNISVSVGKTSLKGEAVITTYGLEGNAIYPLIPKIRALLNSGIGAEIKIDFKPDNTVTELVKKWNKSSSSKDYGKIFNLKREQLAMIKSSLTKEEFLSNRLFINRIKDMSIKVKSLRNIEEAISTVGGIDVEELASDFSLKKYPNIFCIGEMVNWDAPTGGFLLQGAFSMGSYVGNAIMKNKNPEST